MTDGQSEACAANGPYADPQWAVYFDEASNLVQAIVREWHEPGVECVNLITQLAALIRDAERWRAMENNLEGILKKWPKEQRQDAEEE